MTLIYWHNELGWPDIGSRYTRQGNFLRKIECNWTAASPIPPAECPNHHAIGRYFRAWDGQVYYCDSYKYGPDYFMVNVVDRTVRKEVSTAAIGRTFHEVGTADRPACIDDIRDIEKYAVDTLQAMASLAATLVDDKDCVGVPYTTALFYSKWEAEKFIRGIQKASVERIAELAAKTATAS